jgi:hypothetical protein
VAPGSPRWKPPSGHKVFFSSPFGNPRLKPLGGHQVVANSLESKPPIGHQMVYMQKKKKKTPSGH